jgi:hypothetical protein
VTYDGVPGLAAGISTVRAQSAPFALFGDSEGIADGFWHTLVPAPGHHELHIRGSLCDVATGANLFEIDVKYLLDVQ